MTTMFQPHADSFQQDAVPMTNSEIRAVLRRLSFRPGWELHFTKPWCREPRCFCHIAASEPDSRDPRLPIAIRYHILANEVYSEAQLVDAIKQGLKDIDNHEFDEWFRLDGVPVNNPHPRNSNFHFVPRQPFA